MRFRVQGLRLKSLETVFQGGRDRNALLRFQAPNQLTRSADATNVESDLLQAPSELSLVLDPVSRVNEGVRGCRIQKGFCTV